MAVEETLRLTAMDKYAYLKTYFGLRDLREGQAEAVDALLSHRDVLGVMPTGAGKSLCFQLTAMMLPGVTLVISPLISLMQDQIRSLQLRNIPAAEINSAVSRRRVHRIFREAMAGEYKLIYVSPERLQSSSFMRLCEELDISMVAVDEAHCVSQWGHDFRPAYFRVKPFIDSLPVRPVVCAFTATATEAVREDIISLLGLDDPLRIVTGFDRPNLYFASVDTDDKYTSLISYLNNYEGKSGIVYCSTRKNVDNLCRRLSSDGVKAVGYHAGLSDSDREERQKQFFRDRGTVMVATNAFGMGIDKADVAFVIHYNMPGDLESYYQQAGRAGRDGNGADCLLLWDEEDEKTQLYLIDHPENPMTQGLKASLAVRKNKIEKLSTMKAYCESNDCLRSRILTYFGEESRQPCGNCSVCIGLPEVSPLPERVKNIPDTAVYETLRSMRRRIAKQSHLPEKLILTDKALTVLAAEKPVTENQLKNIKGISDAKINRYGPLILAEINGIIKK